MADPVPKHSPTTDRETHPLLPQQQSHHPQAHKPDPDAYRNPFFFVARIALKVCLSLVLIIILAIITSILFLYYRGIGPIGTGHYCEKSHFQRSLPSNLLFGAEITDFAVRDVHDYTPPTAPFMDAKSPFSQNLTNLNFCEVIVSYTHPGYENTVKVTVWLPSFPGTWNRRFQGTGGGGFAAGLGSFGLAAPVARGFAAASTDGGLPSWDPEDWALLSPGNVDYGSLRNFGYQAVHDMTVIGKAVTESFYGGYIAYSYWNGCSTGGRQGLSLAQRWAGDYDGILASAPAVGFEKLMVAAEWGQLVMQMLGEWPQGCEFEAITRAGMEECDELDGVKDGIISLPDKCEFDARVLVNRTIACPNPKNKRATTRISKAAAEVAMKTWEGPRSSDGESLWPGLSHQSSLLRYTDTTCSYSNKPGHLPDCQGSPLPGVEEYICLFLRLLPIPRERYASGSMLNITHEEYTKLFHLSTQMYEWVLGSDDSDLREFERAGGKMITWHGGADESIPMRGSRGYYKSVLEWYEQHQRENASAGMTEKGLNDVRQFYRYYEVPGVGHCSDGPGPVPGMAWDSAGAFDQLMDWVENGVEPDVLHGAMKPVHEGGEWGWRPTCMWPDVAVYRGKKGEDRNEEGWVCEQPKNRD